MKTERLLAAISEIEALEQEQEHELKETRAVLAGMRKLAGNGTGAVVNTPPSTTHVSTNTPMIKKTYAQITLDLLKVSDRPMHINEIVLEIHQVKNLPPGSILRPSVQTSLMRYIQRGGKNLKKAGLGKFKYYNAV